MAASAYDLVWGDGVVPSWLLGMTVLFVLLTPLLRVLFPETCKKDGWFSLLAFELTCAGPVRACASHASSRAPHRPDVPPPLCASVR